MTREPMTRVRIAVLIYSMVNAVLFGAGLIFVLTLPVLSANAGFWISVVVGASLILAALAKGRPNELQPPDRCRRLRWGLISMHELRWARPIQASRQKA